MAQLTGNIKKCDKHPENSCWLWEYIPNIVCPSCRAKQLYLHEPEKGSAQAAGLVTQSVSLPRARKGE